MDRSSRTRVRFPMVQTAVRRGMRRALAGAAFIAAVLAGSAVYAGFGPAQGGGGGGGGGGETFAQTLALGNTTGGADLVVSVGDGIGLGGEATPTADTIEWADVRMADGGTRTLTITDIDASDDATLTVNGSVFSGHATLGAATTAGVRFEVNGGILDAREGDDSALAPTRSLTHALGGDVLLADGGTRQMDLTDADGSDDAQGRASAWIAGAASTAGVRIETSTTGDAVGALEVREGDDSDRASIYAGPVAAAPTISGADFGSASPYLCLLLGDLVDSQPFGPGAGNGGLYGCARAGTDGAAPTNAPYVLVTGFDFGAGTGIDAGRPVIYGGGGWAAPDATGHQFYTSSTYTETADTGLLRLHVANDGKTDVGPNELAFGSAVGTRDCGWTRTAASTITLTNGAGAAGPLLNIRATQNDGSDWALVNNAGLQFGEGSPAGFSVAWSSTTAYSGTKLAEEYAADVALTTGVAANVATVSVANNRGLGGRFTAVIEATDGADTICITQDVTYQVINDADAEVVTFDVVSPATPARSDVTDTLVATWGATLGTNAVTIQCTPTLAGMTATTFRVRFFHHRSM